MYKHMRGLGPRPAFIPESLIHDVQPFPNPPEGALTTTQRPLKPIKLLRRFKRVKIKRPILYFYLHVVPNETPNIADGISNGERPRNEMWLTLHILDRAMINATFREEFHQAPYFHMTDEELTDCSIVSVGCNVGSVNDFEHNKFKIYEKLFLQLYLKSIKLINFMIKRRDTIG